MFIVEEADDGLGRGACCATSDKALDVKAKNK